MIISKNSLQLINLCSPDRAVPQLNCLCINPDGSVVASNSQCIGIITPLPDKQRKLVPLVNNPLSNQIVISTDSVKAILKAIPKDTQFKGLLEHCEVNPAEGKNVEIVTTDGRIRNNLYIRSMASRYSLDYKQAFQENRIQELRGAEICLNRKRLGNIQDVLDKVCSYDGAFAPVWLYSTVGGRILLRSVNELTGQRVLFLFSPSETDDLPFDTHELRLFNPSKANKII